MMEGHIGGLVGSGEDVASDGDVIRRRKQPLTMKETYGRVLKHTSIRENLEMGDGWSLVMGGSIFDSFTLLMKYLGAFCVISECRLSELDF